MAHHFNQVTRRRSSSICHRHPSSQPTTTSFCALCLHERLITIDTQSPSSAVVHTTTPELRRIRSYSVRNASASSVFDQPRRKSCDARSNRSSLLDLFADDNEDRRIPDLKEEEEEEEDIKGFDNGKQRKLVEEEIDKGEEELKTMKEFIDLDLRNQIKTNNGKDLIGIASVFTKRLKHFSLKNQPKDKRKDEKSDSGFAGGGRRHSCDGDPRLSLDGGFEKPRASWDGCLIGKTYHKLPMPLSAVKKSGEEVEKGPGGTVQTKKYYSDSRRRRSFDRKRHGLLEEVDELKVVSPKRVGLFYGANVLAKEKELSDSKWPKSVDVVSKGNICIATSCDRKQDSVELEKPRKKWLKGWNIWGLIQRKTKNGIKTEQGLKLEGNAIEGSLAESLLKLRRVAKGETVGVLESHSVSARKSCDGVRNGVDIVSGFEGGRSSCDGLFHGSINSVEVGRSSCDGLVNGIEGKQNHHLLRRNSNVGTYGRENDENSLFRFYLTPVRSHRSSKSGKSRLMN